MDNFEFDGGKRQSGTLHSFVCEEEAKHPHIEEQAQAVPSPCTSYALFYNGGFLTNEQFNDKKFLKLIQGK
ncbi:MAG: YoaP domain-containing protein [Blautia sp.]